VAPVNQLPVLGRGLPAIAQERARCELLLVERGDKPLWPMLVFSLALHLRGYAPISNRRAVLRCAAALPAAADPHPAPYSLRVATVLGAYPLNDPGGALVRDAVVHKHNGVLALLQPVFDQPPPLPGHKPLLSQPVIDSVVAHVLQVRGPIGTGAVLGAAQPILPILFPESTDKNQEL